MKVYDAKTSFAGGELSPSLYGRVDLEQYNAGARILENFIVLPQGSIINRPGLSSAGSKSYSSVRLVPFVFSEEDSCVLAFYDGAIDVYSGLTLQATITGSPYTLRKLPKLKWLQSADVVYLFHPDVPVHMLMRTSSGWKLQEVKFERGPFSEINSDPDKILKFESTSGGSLFSVKSTNFKISDYASFDQLLYVEREDSAASFDLKIGSTWQTVKGVFGAFTYRTSGKWVGTLEVERCRPDGWRDKDEDDWEWEKFKTHKSGEDSEENFSYSGTVEEYANHYRFKYSGKDGPIDLAFNYEGGLVSHIFELHPNSEYECLAEPIDAMPNKDEHKFETDAWAFGSFSEKNGYPSCGVFHQERLVLACTNADKQSIWMSQPASWHNFATSIPAKDDDAITVTLASKEVNEIRGLASRGDLLIFTAGGEWAAKAGSKSDVFTPSSIVVTPTGYRGSANIMPLEVGDTTLFIQRGCKTVRSIGYSLEVDGYATQDVSILSEHIFSDTQIKAWAYQQEPWSVIWCVLANGTCAALTLQKEQKVTAWSRQVFTNAKIHDVCCVPEEDQDYVYFAVERRYAIKIERLNKRELVSDAFKDIDSYPVNSILETLDWEIKDGRGTLQGRFKHIPAMTLRLLNTKTLKGCVITENTDGSLTDELQFPGQTSPGEYASGLFSGDVRLIPQGGVGRTCRVRLENDMANPVQILAIYPEVVISEEIINAEQDN